MAFTLVRCSGDPYDQGVVQGEVLRAAIAHNLEVYFRRFRIEGGLEEEAVLERSERYLGAIANQNPDYYAGMQGIADGGGFDLPAIGALNVRYEILYHQFAHEPTHPGHVDGCTGFALSPQLAADGRFYMGQNWDWIMDVRGALLHTTYPDGLQVLAFTEAGIFGGKIGLNSEGLGLCINGLVSADDHWARLGKPFHVRTYEALRSRTLAQAQERVLEQPRSGSANFLLGQNGQALDIEVAPTGQAIHQGAFLAHANHFVNPQAAGIRVAEVVWLDRSERREGRMQELLAAQSAHSRQNLMDCLSDQEGTPYAICRRPSQEEFDLGEPYQTVASVLLDLSAKEMWVTDGPPDENPFECYAL